MGERQAARSCPLELGNSGDRSFVLRFVDALLPPSKPGEQWGRAKEQKRPQIRTDRFRGLRQALALMPKHLHHPWVMAA